MRIGLREANQKFSKVMKAVKGGEEVLVTERGKPLAVIKAVPGSEKEATAVHRLEAAGLLRPASKAQPLPLWTPRPVKGVPLSKTLREERDAS
ncbi:MAG: type II toxin-antitoxin system prevent-host-death family antitoxin [Nitrospirae bacterium]|nr:type II toxin-antitoxin system prevent-host-death family antitoxin [Nitrospirota bacterium]